MARMTLIATLCAFLASTLSPSFSVAQDKVPASVLHGYADILQMIETSSFYEMSSEELLKLHHCAMQKIFLSVKIPKGTTLEKDFMVPSCFPKDRHAGYSTPLELKHMQREREGKFFGIGVEIEKVAEGFRVKKLIPGGPAEKSGLLQPHDVIVAVLDPKKQPTAADAFINLKDLPAGEAVEQIIGPEGTLVILKVMREGKEVVIQMTRGPVTLTVVKSEELEPGIGYLKLTTFLKEEIVPMDVIPALNHLAAKNPLRALVIDLRDNGGGDVQAAFDFLNLFAPEANRVMIEERFRTGTSRVYRTEKTGMYAKIPLAVLVNENSASASELVSGVLQIWGAKIIGTQTFRKGSGQIIEPVTGKGALRLTVFKFFFENGKTPDGVGITPDIVVSEDPLDTATGLSPQVKKALEHLREELAKQTPH